MGKGDRKTYKGKRFIGSRKKRTKLNCYGIIPKTQNKRMDYTYVIYRVFLNTIYVIHGILCRWLLPRLGSGVRVSFPAPDSKKAPIER